MVIIATVVADASLDNALLVAHGSTRTGIYYRAAGVAPADTTDKVHSVDNSEGGAGDGVVAPTVAPSDLPQPPRLELVAI